MHIKLADLRSISEKLFTYLESQGVESLDVKVDYYWHIPKEQIYDPYQEPSELDLGQLTDDWCELQKLLDTDSQPITYCFVWLAAILRAIDEHTPT
ncbi:MAG: hypothetical protein GY845_07275 [Planctomycetes bacterium]|nr:hypothetical protein [Planctomycetota bacterium]